jgi:hypothetical protein
MDGEFYVETARVHPALGAPGGAAAAIVQAQQMEKVPRIGYLGIRRLLGTPFRPGVPTTHNWGVGARTSPSVPMAEAKISTPDWRQAGPPANDVIVTTGTPGIIAASDQNHPRVFDRVPSCPVTTHANRDLGGSEQRVEHLSRIWSSGRPSRFLPPNGKVWDFCNGRFFLNMGHCGVQISCYSGAK